MEVNPPYTSRIAMPPPPPVPAAAPPPMVPPPPMAAAPPPAGRAAAPLPMVLPKPMAAAPPPAMPAGRGNLSEGTSKLKSRSDIPACLAVGRFLAERAKEADVYTCTYTPRERDKFEGKIRAVVQSLIDNGINVKLYLD